MMAFGAWLASRREQVRVELFVTSINSKQSPAAIRVKAGHVEALSHVLEAFTELYKGDVKAFRVQYLGEEETKEEESDGQDTTRDV